MKLKLDFEVFLPEELEEALKLSAGGNAEPLRSLCRKEVCSFETYVRRADPQFRDGLARFERIAIEGYLYQKLRGHLNAEKNQTDLPKERQDGPKTST